MRNYIKQLQKELSLIHTKSIFKISLISLVLFYLYYGLFYLFFNPIHNFYPAVGPSNIIYYHRLALLRDGLESKLMLVGSFVFVGLVLYLSSQKQIIKLIGNSNLLWLIYLPLFFILAQTRSEIFKFAPLLFCITLMVVVTSLIFIFQLSRFQILFGGVGFLLFLAVVVLSLDQASIYDWNYFLAPARKMIQEERLGSYYMQYSLLGTFLVKLFMEFSLKVYQMQLITALIFGFWFLLYFFLARKLITNRRILIMFCLSLVILRFFAINHDPTAVFQVTPIRIDLWVLPMLVLCFFGFNSFFTSLVFASIYFFDNLFGFIYAGLYLVALVLIDKKLKGKLIKFGILASPILLSSVFNLYFFESLTSPSALMHDKLQIDFLPISHNSPFWIVFAFLPVGFYIMSLEKEYKKRILKLYLFSLLLVQLIYFYGRSHDHNLLNISGLIVLNLFIWFDSLSENLNLKRFSLLFCSLTILLSSILFSGHIYTKLERVLAHLRSGQIMPVSFIEDYVEKNPDLFKDIQKPLLLSPYFDGYFNYRYNLPQVGYFSPFYRNEYVDKTIQFIIDQINLGFSPVFTKWDPQMHLVIEQFNSDPYLKDKGMQFSITKAGKVEKISLVDLRDTLSKIDQTKKYYAKGLTFVYPKDWLLKNDAEKINIQDPKGIFTISIGFVQSLNKQSLETFLNKQTIQLGQLVNQGLAKIPNVDASYVKIWRVDNIQLMQFFLFSGEKVVEVRVSPADSVLMRGFDQVLGSIKIE